MAKAKTPTSASDKTARPSTAKTSSSTAKPKTAATKTASVPPVADQPKPAASDTPKDQAAKVAPKSADTAGPGKEPVAKSQSGTPKVKKQDASQTSTSAPTGAKQGGGATDTAKTADAKPAIGTDAPKPTAAAKSTPATSAESIAAKSTREPQKTAGGADAAKASTSTSTAAASAVKPPAKESTVSTKPAAPEKRRGGFFPMVLGGVIAGGIGFAVAEYDLLERFGLKPPSQPVIQDTVSAEDLAAQAARITALEQAEPAVAAPDEAALEGLEASVAELSARIETLENRPAPTMTQAEPVDTSAFEAELEGLKSSVVAQRDEIQKLLDNALSVEEATAQAAQAAALQSAVARIVAALSTGQPFEAEIADLEASGMGDIPPALADTAATGVVTSANLQDRFAGAARASLAAARANATDGESSGFGGFLRQQLGARSIAPRDGADPDAILSRAEAAVRDGHLAEALTELAELPEVAQAPLSEWLTDAKARQAAQDAVQTLTQRLTAN